MKKIICTVLAVILALSALSFAASAEDIVSASSLPREDTTGEPAREGPAGEMIMTGRAPSDQPAGQGTDAVTNAGDNVKAESGDTFAEVYAQWRVAGYPENVAGVTCERVTRYGGECIVSYTPNEYTVLVTDDSPEAIEKIRTWKTDGKGVTVNFAKSVIGYSGDTVTMKYTYDELAVVANSIIGDIIGRNDMINVDGSGRTAVFAKIEELSNRVVITLYRYCDANGKPVDPEKTNAVAKFYRGKYSVDCVTIKETEYNISGGAAEITVPVWETGMAPVERPVRGDGEKQPKFYPVRDRSRENHVPTKEDSGLKPLYAALVLIAALAIPVAALCMRGRAETLATAGGGTRTRTSAPDESEILRKVSDASEKPSDGLFDKIMKNK